MKKKKNKTEMIPFLKYPGGKSKEIPVVIKNLPKNIERYVEPFVGGGSIYFAMNIADSYINDKSKDLYSLYILIKNQNLKFKEYLEIFDKYWKKLSQKEISKIEFNESYLDYGDFKQFYSSARKRKDSTIRKFEKEGAHLSSEDFQKMEVTARKTAFYMLIRKLYNLKDIDEVLHGACFYFIREYCYSSMFRFSKSGDFNVPYGGMSYNEKYLSSKIDYIFSDEMKSYLKNTTIKNMDFEDFLNETQLTENDFIFLDPPYDSDFSTYDNNVFDKKEQIRLHDYLKKTEAKWMLIIKKTDFIYDLYKTFNIYEYDKNYMVSFKNRNEKDVKHLLITNYTLETGEKENG